MAPKNMTTATGKSRKGLPLIVKLLAAVVLTVLTGYAALRVSPPELRTRVYAKHPSSLDEFVPFFDYRASLWNPMAPVWVDLEPGVKMELDPYDLVSRILLVNGVWERDIWQRVEANLPVDGVFVDVGAHIGYYSLKAAHRVGSKGAVIAVEPNPQTLTKLRANIGANHAGQTIQVFAEACSDQEADLEFFAAPRANTGESSLSLKNASQEGEVSGRYTVHARPLDEIIEDSGIQRLDVLKIDVEGADFLVLKGSERTIERFHPVIYVETVDQQLREMGSSVAEVTAFLTARGYSAREIDAEKRNTEFVPRR